MVGSLRWQWQAGEQDGRREDLGLAAAHRGGANAERQEEAQQEGLRRARHGWGGDGDRDGDGNRRLGVWLTAAASSSSPAARSKRQPFGSGLGLWHRDLSIDTTSQDLGRSRHMVLVQHQLWPVGVVAVASSSSGTYRSTTPSLPLLAILCCTERSGAAAGRMQQSIPTACTLRGLA